VDPIARGVKRCGLEENRSLPCVSRGGRQGFRKAHEQKRNNPPHFSTHLFLLRHGCGHPQPSIFELIIELYQTGNITVRT